MRARRRLSRVSYTHAPARRLPRPLEELLATVWHAGKPIAMADEQKSTVPLHAPNSIVARHAVLSEPDGTVSYEECGTYDHIRFGTSTAVVERNSVLLIPGVTHAGGSVLV